MKNNNMLGMIKKPFSKQEVARIEKAIAPKQESRYLGIGKRNGKKLFFRSC